MRSLTALSYNFFTTYYMFAQSHVNLVRNGGIQITTSGGTNARTRPNGTFVPPVGHLLFVPPVIQLKYHAATVRRMYCG